MVSLAAFAWLLTLTGGTAAGGTFAAYGGVYIVASHAWLRSMEGMRPDRWDTAGAFPCMAGAVVIMAGPHQGQDRSAFSLAPA